MNEIIYGPVASWRLGRSLGVDLISQEGKTCSFDCIYCQLGKTKAFASGRSEYISIDTLARELISVKGIAADFVTFSGTGEPTLASNLGDAIQLVRDTLDLPVAILTNSSLISLDDVRRDLSRADVVVAKMDAPDEHTFQMVNRPVEGIRLNGIIEGIKKFRSRFSGRLALQMMFMEENYVRVSDMAELAAAISPNEVQVNTPTRPCAVRPLAEDTMISIKSKFKELGDRVVMVYESQKPAVEPVNMEQTLRRRPQL
ncbi:MAG: radical SAM protein [Dehalococcoidia bacterium]